MGANIKLVGEREYRAALSQIGSALKQLQSELDLSSEKFKDNAKSEQALREQGDILNRQILTQQEKISKLQEVLQKSGEAYGESDTRTMKWATSLNKAETELLQMQRELNENTDAIKKMTPPLDKVKKALAETKEQGGGVKTALANLKEEFSLNTDSAKGLGTALTDIAGKFGVQLPDGAAKAAEALNGINAGAALAVTGLGLLAAAIVKVEKQLISMTKESAAYADNILTLSLTTGQTTDQLQEFSYASELIDVSLDTLQGSLTKLTNNMQDTANGTGNAQAAFQQLGVSVTDADGHLRSANDVFYDAIDALGDVTNATERDALAMDIFGRSAQDLNPLIVQGADTLREYAQEAHDMGYVLDNDALAALGAVDDAYQRLQKTQEGVKNQLSEQFAPYLTEFYEKITRLIKDGGQALKDSGLVDAFGMILESVGDLIAPTNELSENSVPKLTQALRPLAEVMAGIADTIDFIRGLVAFNSNPIWSADKWKGLSQMGKAAGFGYSYGNGNHTQTLKEKWMQTDTNYATGANGYGEYFGNGKYYGNRDAYLYALWEEELNSGKPVGSFEAWKMQKGYNASGTDFWRGGRTLIGENGPEEVVLPRGSRILTAQETRQSGGGDIYYVTIEARTVKEFNDIARIARNKRRTDRMGVDKA